jgi:uncharacterized RDD family membrane protein YckC
MQNENIPQPINQQPPAQTPITVSPPVASVVQQGLPQAGFNYDMSRRVSAFVLDVVLWIPLFIVASQHFGTYNVGNGNINFNLTGIPFVVFLVVFTAYYVLFECLAGGTLGKLAVGIRVTDEQGNKPSFVKSLVRNVLRIVDGFPYILPNLVGFIVASTNDKKQRLGDKAAHTLVAKTDNAKPAATKAWLSLAVLVVAGIAVIILVPASKLATSSTSNKGAGSFSLNTSSSLQNQAAKAVSDQVFNYVISGDTQAIYQLASPALKQAQTEAQLATGLQQMKQIIVGSPQPTNSQSSYPANGEAQFVYPVQTTQGNKSMVVQLGLVNGNWLLYSARIL